MLVFLRWLYVAETAAFRRRFITSAVTALD
jgi:hypothetical protein